MVFLMIRMKIELREICCLKQQNLSWKYEALILKIVRLIDLRKISLLSKENSLTATERRSSISSFRQFLFEIVSLHNFEKGVNFQLKSFDDCRKNSFRNNESWQEIDALKDTSKSIYVKRRFISIFCTNEMSNWIESPIQGEHWIQLKSKIRK